MRLRQQTRGHLTWRPCEAEPGELAAAEREATTGAQFDRAGLKRGVWEAWRASKAQLRCWSLSGPGDTAQPLARIVCFLPVGRGGATATAAPQQPPFELWRRIFMWFGPAADGGPWRMTWFASPTPRHFPGVGQDLGPEHVNGGYTRPCSSEGIFIYRAEEVTRVLVHELLHAACLDEAGPGWTIPLREAQIEVWAELILVAVLSKGDAGAAEKLWAAQAQWVSDVNWKASAMHGTHDITDYAWRYLCGREQMYARLGVPLPAARPVIAARMTSTRFTDPMLGR